MTLTKPNPYETKTIRLMSPIVHIGSEVQRLNPFEYVQTPSKVYIPDSEALARQLYNRGRLKDYISAIENRQGIANLLEDTFGEDWENVTDDTGRPIFPDEGTRRKWTDDRITDLRPMIRNGNGQFYIPGSSIKGAIRTAIAYHLLKYSDRYGVPQANRVSAIEKELRSRLDRGQLEKKFEQKRTASVLFEEALFTEFDLTYQGRSANVKRYGPNTDFMRAVSVSDTDPLVEKRVKTKKGTAPANIPIVSEVVVSSRFPNRNAKYRASIYVEMVNRVRTEFTLSIDGEMLDWFRHSQGMKIPFSTVDELLAICQDFAQEQWDFDHDYWNSIRDNLDAGGERLNFVDVRRFYNPEKCPFTLRIGWGSGMTGTTIGLRLGEELRSQLRDAVGISAPNFEAPKSRRSIRNRDGEITLVPGWAKFKVL